ncbi:hypothetical protein WR25_19694 [Diploscapter pachys]|uniref:Uncharacterized protein n=1 Tax=Diploscapter pachys TaxID=2018661 RepID=A0A2A2JVN5_9BILA|nr:hypothetical protein WR25_19694 [Diploscapter pachys]
MTTKEADNQLAQNQVRSEISSKRAIWMPTHSSEDADGSNRHRFGKIDCVNKGYRNSPQQLCESSKPCRKYREIRQISLWRCPEDQGTVGEGNEASEMDDAD